MGVFRGIKNCLLIELAAVAVFGGLLYLFWS